jgi:hypothetical protein
VAGADRPNSIPAYNGTGWFRQAALAVNYLLQRDTGAVDAIYAPLVNGDLPGPVLMANADGECIMVEVS